MHARWKKNSSIDYLGTSYMREFFTVCQELGAESVVVTSEPGETYLEQLDETLIANFPKPDGLKGAAFHVALMRWTNNAFDFLSRQNLTHLLLTDANDYWFLLGRSPLRHVKLVASHHAALEPAFGRNGPIHALLHKANRHLFYRRMPAELLSASPLISRQLVESCGGKGRPPELFLPLYDADLFDEALQDYPSTADRPFSLLSAGRIVDNKGVFDLLDAVQLAEREMTVPLHLHYAGDGPHLERLQNEVAQRGAQDRVTLHGYCGKEALLDLMRQSHAVVVPTRSELVEGFAMICAEAILAGRPLITSRVCPALELLRPASLEAQPDDPASYAEAIVALATQPDLLAEKRAAVAPLRQQFLDPANSYGATLKGALVRLGV